MVEHTGNQTPFRELLFFGLFPCVFFFFVYIKFISNFSGLPGVKGQKGGPGRYGKMGPSGLKGKLVGKNYKSENNQACFV